MMTTHETNEAPEPIRVPMSVVKAAAADGRIEGMAAGLLAALDDLRGSLNIAEAEERIEARIVALKSTG